MLRADPDGEAGDRLSNAYDKVRAAWESTPPVRELSPSYALSNIWPALTMSYSGIEQILKYLLARARGLSVAELVALPRDASREPHGSFKSHDLSWLFGQLEPPVRTAIDADFRTFLTLYSYIPYDGLDDFLLDISGQRGDGYQRWRYILVEFDASPPRNSPDAMLAIWRCLLLELARQSEWTALFAPLPQHVEDDLLHRLREVESRAIDAAHSGRGPFSGSDDVLAIDTELDAWFASSTNRLTAFASVLHHCHNRGTPGIDSASGFFSAVLMGWYREVAEACGAENSATTMFARRAWGDDVSYGAGPSVVWDEQARLFRPTPWTLELLTSGAPPQDGVIVADLHRFSPHFPRLRRLAADCGYRFLENRSFPPDVPDTRWCRVHEFREPGPSGEVLLTFWQRRGDEDFFYACEGPALPRAHVLFSHAFHQAARLGAKRFRGPPMALD